MTNKIPILTKPQTKIDKSPKELLINQLPPELLNLIFQNLSETDLLKVRKVCRLWNALIEENSPILLPILKIIKILTTNPILSKNNVEQALLLLKQKRTSKKYLKTLNSTENFLINRIIANIPRLRRIKESIPPVRLWFLMSELLGSTDLIPEERKFSVKHFKKLGEFLKNYKYNKTMYKKSPLEIFYKIFYKIFCRRIIEQLRELFNMF